ncbi:MAG: hypothetical protein AAF626_02390 [Pseudomonadota bacterium]
MANPASTPMARQATAPVVSILSGQSAPPSAPGGLDPERDRVRAEMIVAKIVKHASPQALMAALLKHSEGDADATAAQTARRSSSAEPRNA